MIARRATRRPSRFQRLPAAIATGFALIGAVLITVAACTSQPGAPQPSAAAAGSIAPTSIATSAPSLVVTPEVTESAAPASTSAASAEPAPAAEPAPPPAAPLLLPAAAPVSISIPAINASSAVLDLGLAADGTIEVPPINEPDSKAGWYDQSPSPGTLGPSIFLGHIDSVTYGPGIFYDLGRLNPGDTIEITRDDNTVAIFQVDGVQVFEKADFPTISVYGNLDHAGLRLITCGGVFNSDTGHYESNTVVFATLVSSRQA